MRTATQAEYDEAVNVYDKGGQYAVYEYAISKGITSWDVCMPCEDRTPNTDDSSCLVCGSLKD